LKVNADTTGKDQYTLAVRGLTKRYGPLTVLEDVTFAAGQGQIIALLGPNGAGKTTTFKCILGVIRFQGQVEVDGLDVRSQGKAARARLGYLPQAPAFSAEDSCEQALYFLAELRGAGPEEAERLLERVQLAQYRRRRTGLLSGGMRQRLALAAALLGDPAILLLDEPTANLDRESRDSFYEVLEELRAEGKTILLSTHMPDSIGPLADRVVLLREGRVVLDQPAEDVLRAAGRRFLVQVNGTAPGRFLAALEEIGIKPEQVRSLSSALEWAAGAALEAKERNAEGLQ
jgi:ABC-type multidrug transport system ATPase subunit